MASFQNYINKILTEKLDIYIMVNLNDFFIYIKNSSQDYMKAIK